MLVYPSLDYELNTQVRIHREANGYTQEEFAFLIGRDVADVIRYEDLTAADAYDFNHINRYARVLHRVPRDFVFRESLPENDIKIEAKKTVYKTKTTFRGERQILVGGKPQWVKLEPYSIPNDEIAVDPANLQRMVELLDGLLLEGYFQDGVTGYDSYQCIQKIWSGDLRPKLVIEGLKKLSGRRKRPKLLPMRDAPKTDEKWVLYKEDFARNTYSFDIVADRGVSNSFLEKGIDDFIGAAQYVEQLPYRRNQDKNNPTAALGEHCGTCSTKHALLKRLADENGHPELKLVLGIYQMNGSNTPAVAPILKKYKLKYIPEAHNYLRVHGYILDFTGLGMRESKLANSLLTEIEITPEQITDFKVGYHRDYLANWLADESLPYSLEEIWRIREECIGVLAAQA